MGDVEIMRLARQIEANGGTIYADVPAVGGGRHTRVEPADLPLFLASRDAWVAKVCEIAPGELDLYEREGRVPRCGAPTKSGRPCRMALAPDSDPAMFVRMHGRERCQVHG